MSEGYIYVVGWEKFQHPDALRSTSMPWIKLHLDIFGNDEWLRLEPADRVLLLGIWNLVARFGNGRLRADRTWIAVQAGLPASNRYRGIERLIQAGFIEIHASKAARSVARKVAGTEGEGSSNLRREERFASSARRNGAARKHRNQVAVAVGTATSWLEDDAPHLVHRTVRETWPDLADEIIRQLPRAETTPNGSDLEKPAPQEPLSAPRAEDRDPGHAEIGDDDIPF